MSVLRDLVELREPLVRAQMDAESYVCVAAGLKTILDYYHFPAPTVLEIHKAIENWRGLSSFTEAVFYCKEALGLKARRGALGSLGSLIRKTQQDVPVACAIRTTDPKFWGNHTVVVEEATARLVRFVDPETATPRTIEWPAEKFMDWWGATGWCWMTVDRPAQRLSEARGPVGRYVDGEGYASEVVPMPRSDPESMAGLRRGRNFIVRPDGARVRGGYWMDFPEKGWAIDGVNLHKDFFEWSDIGSPEESHWRKRVPIQTRLDMEAKQQATAYDPLSAQYEFRRSESFS